MSLENTINADIKTAMIAREKDKLNALRAVKAAILLAKTEKGAEGGLTEDTEIKLLQKLVKQRKDSFEIYKNQGHEEMANEEFYQFEIINKYLPEALDEDEVMEIVKAVVEKTGATSMKDMGKVMGMASKELAGKADNKLVAGIIKILLS